MVSAGGGSEGVRLSLSRSSVQQGYFLHCEWVTLKVWNNFIAAKSRDFMSEPWITYAFWMSFRVFVPLHCNIFCLRTPLRIPCSTIILFVPLCIQKSKGLCWNESETVSGRWEFLDEIQGYWIYRVWEWWNKQLLGFDEEDYESDLPAKDNLSSSELGRQQHSTRRRLNYVMWDICEKSANRVKSPNYQ